MTLRTTTRQPFALERSYRKQYTPDLIDLSSSAATPAALSDVLIPQELAGLAESSLGYEPGGGSHALREAVASLYNRLGPDNVVITAGALEAIRAAAMALVEPGQQVTVPAPSYGALRQAVLDAGGRIAESAPSSPSLTHHTARQAQSPTTSPRLPNASWSTKSTAP